jgi:hypothetical protein
VLDEEWENTFRRWYPDFRPQSASQESGLIPRNLPLSYGQLFFFGVYKFARQTMTTVMKCKFFNPPLFTYRM